MADLISTTTRRARKPYLCGVCSMEIERGTVYRRLCLRYEGTAYDWREAGRAGELAPKVGA